VIIASFTNAASQELVGRNLPVSDKQVGTLHSHCYRNLECPEVVYNKLGEFNDYAPQYRLSEGIKQNLDNPRETSGRETEGDKLFLKYETLRAKMLDRQAWPTSIKYFADWWESWKKDNGLIDFTDMIELNLIRGLAPPGDPHIGFFDEAQDFTKLELSLIRYWSEHMSHIVVVGDDDQNLYEFKGALPEAFMDPPLPDENVSVLNQSYRVPRKVQIKAERWIKQVDNRKDKEYKPRDYDGEILRLKSGNYKNPIPMLEHMKQYLDQDKEVMILTSCGYMLKPTLSELKKRGLPFHNPYNRNRNDWNPLHFSGRGTSSADKVLAFFRLSREVYGDNARLWSINDLRKWFPLIRSKGNLVRGAKSKLKDLHDELEEERYDELTVSNLLEFFEPEALDNALDQNFDWFMENMLESKKTGSMDLIENMVRKNNPEIIKKKPQIKTGTIHSVKGGEAEVVYLFPDLSWSGMQEYSNSKTKDRVVRQFYVGMTRASQSLITCSPAGRYRANI